MQEEYNMTLRMNLDSLEAFEQHIFSDQDIEDLINRALDSLPTKCKNVNQMIYADLGNWKGKSKNRSPPN